MHVPELDGVRGVAILLVMLLHFLCSLNDGPQNLIERLTVRFTGYGAWGVDLFFVLSGYLITGILYDTRGGARYFRTFYMRRTLRIFPLYYGVLFLILVVIPTSVLQSIAPEALKIRDVQGWLWPYLTNVYIAKQGSFSIPYISHFWTLAIEEHFYLFWPFVVGLLDRKLVMRICVVLSLSALALRIGFNEAGMNPLWAHTLTPCRLDSLCMGSLFALALRGPEGRGALDKKAPRGLAIAAALVLLTSAWHAVRGTFEEIVEPLRVSSLALFFACFVTLSASERGPALLKSVLRWRSLRTLGKYSYGLYVFHGIVAYELGARVTYHIVERWVGSRTLALYTQAVLGMGASFAIAYVSYELYESRFLKLKKWFEPTVRRNVLEAAAAAAPRPQADS